MKRIFLFFLLLGAPKDAPQVELWKKTIVEKEVILTSKIAVFMNLAFPMEVCLGIAKEWNQKDTGVLWYCLPIEEKK